MIEQTLLDLMLMQYAVGTLNPYESFVVAAHVALNPKARKKIAAYETIAGQQLCQIKPANVSTACLDELMKKIDQSCTKEKLTHAPNLPNEKELEGVPGCIANLIHAHCAKEKHLWHQTYSGVRRLDIHLCTSEPRHKKLRLIEIAANYQVPAHRHAGREITLVLSGGFSDHTGHYTAGDIVIIEDRDFVHAPLADETGCTALTLTEGPLRFAQPLLRIFTLIRPV